MIHNWAQRKSLTRCPLPECFFISYIKFFSSMTIFTRIPVRRREEFSMNRLSTVPSHSLHPRAGFSVYRLESLILGQWGHTRRAPVKCRAFRGPFTRDAGSRALSSTRLGNFRDNRARTTPLLVATTSKIRIRRYSNGLTNTWTKKNK